MATRGLALAVVFSLSACCLDVISGVHEDGGEGSGTGTTGASSTGLGRGASSTTGGTTTGTSLIVVGPCTGDAQCASGICGVNGSGNCCQAACESSAPPCGATDCDAETGACHFPGSNTGCGEPACDGDALTGAGVCDGAGSCSAHTFPCADDNFCDPFGVACCARPGVQGAANTVTVDSVTGKDGPCCGLSGAPCRTINRAMQLIRAAGTGSTIIAATVDGGGGDWGPAETYPVVLGSYAALMAPGVYFNDQGGNPELFDVALGSATIMGSDEEDVSVGIDQLGAHSTDLSTIKVEDGNTLYLLDATIASSMSSKTTAVTVEAGGTLRLAETESETQNAARGTVTIGSDAAGWNGIVCPPGTSAGGCYIEALSNGGLAAVQIQGQQNLDIDAEDGAEIYLSGAIIGFPPAARGFGECPAKPDTGFSNGPAVRLHGNVTASVFGAMVQCIEGTGFSLEASENGTPGLSLGGTTIQNTSVGIHATAGTAVVYATGIDFNAVGVWQDQNGNIQLSADGQSGECTIESAGGNEMACNSGKELGQVGGGVSVLNTSPNFMNACGNTWDTVGPDLFLCNTTFNSCMCELASCTEAGGAGEDMDAVYTSGPIITAGSSLSPLNCGEP